MRRLGATVLGVLVVASCAKSPASTSPSPTPTTTSQRPAASTSQTPAPTGNPGGRRIPPPRDSMTKLRAAYVAQVMQQIAGRENEPAEVVFKNVQVLKGFTAAAPVRKKDEE